jgi:hypothetical protein
MMLAPTTTLGSEMPQANLDDEARQMIEDAGYNADYVAERDSEVDLSNAEPIIDGLPGFNENETQMWIDSARELYATFGPRRPPTRSRQGGEMVFTPAAEPDAPAMSDDEIAQWGVELMGSYNYRPEEWLNYFTNAENMTERQKVAFYNLLSGYDKLPDGTWSGTMRMLKGTLTSPSTYLGIGTLGAGFAARKVFKDLGKTGVMNYMKSLMPTAIAAGVEGGLYTGLDDAMRQISAIDAGAQDEFSVGQTAVSAGVGMVMGGALGLGLPAAGKGAVEGAKLLNRGLDAGVEMMGGGRTFGMGVGPVDTPEQALEAVTSEAVNTPEGLTRLIKENPDGFTVDPSTGEWPSEGYVVAPLKRTEIVLDSAELNEDVAAELLENVVTMTQLTGSRVYAGGWLNEGKYYLDATMIFDNEADALYASAAGRQIALFDLGTFNEVNTVAGFKNLRESGTFDVRRFNEQRANSAQLDERAAEAGIQDAASRARSSENLPEISMAPEGARAHKVPHNLLMSGNGSDPQFKVTQAFSAANKAANFSAIDQAKAAHPDALKSPENWAAFEQDTFGGDLLPVPPMEAIRYAQSPQAMADKLSQLTPEMKAGVDEGFANVAVLRDMYASGEADTEVTANLFVWGILSRGAGPVQQESAYIDIIDDAGDLIRKAVDGKFTDADLAEWEKISGSLPEGSPGKQVTMNVNATGKLLFELGKKPEGSDQTVLETLHDMIGNTDMTAAQIRRKFMELTESAGIDNKVVSFILLVSGRDDVLVMDRIQSRHLWDDGRFEGRNIYDGYKKKGTKAKEGLQGIMRGPRGMLVTEALEDGLRGNVAEAYRLIGREQDASLGRFHWESWVIDGEQVVDHETLKAVASKNPVGVGVSEGKPATFSSGMRYMRGEAGTVVEYPLADGSNVFMTPTQMKEFEAYVKDEKNGIIPKDFKVTERTDVRWYERPEVDRDKLDAAAREFANADAQGQVVRGSAKP